MASMDQKKVLIVLTSVDQFPNGKPTGWYISEAVHPYVKFTEAGFAVDFASISGKATVDPGSLPGDKESQMFWSDDELRKKTESAPALDTIDASAYDALFFAAGFGVMWDFCGTAENNFMGNDAAAALIRSMYEAGKPVGAVCHGPIVFAEVTLTDGTHLVKDKMIAGFTNAEEEAAGNLTQVEAPTGPGTTQDRLMKRGARVVLASNWSVNVVQDGNIFSGQNPQSAGPLAARMAAAMTSEAKPELLPADSLKVPPSATRSGLVGRLFGGMAGKAA